MFDFSYKREKEQKENQIKLQIMLGSQEEIDQEEENRRA